MFDILDVLNFFYKLDQSLKSLNLKKKKLICTTRWMDWQICKSIYSQSLHIDRADASVTDRTEERRKKLI